EVAGADECDIAGRDRPGIDQHPQRRRPEVAGRGALDRVQVAVRVEPDNGEAVETRFKRLEGSDVRAAAATENERRFGELARKRKALLAEGVLRDYGRFGVGERQEGRFGHRVASFAPRPGDADEPGRELASADVALIARAERHGRVRVAVGARGPKS